jgi:hypothetical protein
MYIYSEYAAVKNLIIPTGISATVEYDAIDVIKKISLSRLIEGGAAILEAANRNHHIDIRGALAINPLVKCILRVCVTS